MTLVAYNPYLRASRALTRVVRVRASTPSTIRDLEILAPLSDLRAILDLVPDALAEPEILKNNIPTLAAQLCESRISACSRRNVAVDLQNAC